MAEKRQGYMRAVPLANGVLGAASLYALGWSLFSVLKHKQNLYLELGPVLVAVAAAMALRLRPAARLTVTAIAIGAGAGLYVTELVSAALVDPDRIARDAIRDVAARDGVPYDGRPKIDVVMDLRRRGVEAFPPFYPYLTFQAPLIVDGVPTLPLGSISNVVTVCCNEGGQYLIYPTDEHGFANPPGLWKQAPIDIALVGASIATGECVPSADSIAAQLRTRYPKTISLGAGGNGPLMELASVREYLPALRPARVLWIFPESHPNSLDKEKDVPLLNYLDESYYQGLIERQAGVDRAVRTYLEDAVQAELHPAGSLRAGALDFLMLKRLRIGVFDLRHRLRPPAARGLDSELYVRVLRRGKQIVDAWGGKISIIYVPDTSRFVGAYGYSPEQRRSCEATRAAVLRAAQSFGIPVIDVTPAFPDLPASQTAEYDRYFYPYLAHFKPEGYRVMDRAILEAVR